MKILAIETSCDDTGIAIMEAGEHGRFEVLANIVSSQIKIHKKYGGVFPAMAKREHQKNLTSVLIQSLKKSGLLKTGNTGFKTSELQNILEREPGLYKKIVLFFKNHKKPNIDLISVTNGPGLEPCLWVGVNFARALSYVWDIPIVPVNHIEGHILVNFLEHKKIKFPAIALVVSGGHTQIILVKGVGKYKILGETRDDAAGECFDKCAKILGLPYPGGPEIFKLAEKAKPGEIKLPRPMINTPDYDFSFSGLKTAVLYADQKATLRLRSGQEKQKYKAEMSAEVQQAIIDVLIKKTIKAVKDYKAKTLILGGGVSANKELKSQFEKAIESNRSTPLTGLELIFPPVNLSTDNGLMTAITAYFHRNKKVPWKTLKADANLRIS